MKILLNQVYAHWIGFFLCVWSISQRIGGFEKCTGSSTSTSSSRRIISIRFTLYGLISNEVWFLRRKTNRKYQFALISIGLLNIWYILQRFASISIPVIHKPSSCNVTTWTWAFRYSTTSCRPRPKRSNGILWLTNFTLQFNPKFLISYFDKSKHLTV